MRHPLAKHFLIRTLRVGLLLGASSLLWVAPRGRAQEPPAEPTAPADERPPIPEKTPSEAPEKTPAKPAKSKGDKAIQSAPDQPIWDPLRAEKDLEVGRYYMKRGDWDAAIDRFEDATTAKPGYAIPFRYLGEAQEKKGQKRAAIKSYTRYLDLFPHAEDADKVRKRIDKLWSEAGKGKKSAG